jgi:hypothetical protein
VREKYFRVSLIALLHRRAISIEPDRMRSVEFVEIHRGGLGDFVPFLLLTLKHF